jgi:DNA-binding GntR family transcriptional regulator
MIVAKISLQQLLSLWEVLAELEGIAARLCCMRMNDTELSNLVEIHNESKAIAMAQDLTAWQTNNLKFHEIIYHGTRNPYLRQEVLRIRTRTGYHRMHAFGALGHIQNSFEQHEAIVKALQSRNPEVASLAMTTHMKAAVDASGLTNFIINLPQETLS